jgi:hypothetical protein
MGEALRLPSGNVAVKTKWLERRQERVVSIEENSKSESVAEKILPGCQKLPAKCSPLVEKQAGTRKQKVGVTRVIGDPSAVL